MSSSKPSISLLAYIIIILLVAGTCSAELTVAIFNTLPANAPPLDLHCKSGDDDLGPQTLGLSQMYTWKFYTNFWGTTLFWCNFWWDGKHAGFHVYDSTMMPYEVHGLLHFVYEARPDGFYFYTPDTYTSHTFQWQLVKKWE
ncbi:S-protein homolog 21-like [Apium graveolens]|uniref:S-protein homolog 21-like n=1 Tax=Apium graveolens TaxID=4045 RepID=UPI003D7AA013